MDFTELFQKYSPKLGQYAVPLVLGVVGLIFLAYGMMQYFAGHTAQRGLGQDKQDILFDAASTSTSNVAGAASHTKEVVVDIEGAVEKPGVYKLASEARVQDVLIAAGGMSKDADRERVARGTNLAGKIIDGGKIYIPFLGDSALQNSDIMLSSGSLGQGGADASGLIDLNSASASQLDSLSGVGPVTSQKIISNRPYSKIEDLLEKKVVGIKSFEQIKGKVTVQ